VISKSEPAPFLCNKNGAGSFEVSGVPKNAYTSFYQHLSIFPQFVSFSGWYLLI
jgi:hypothetical protein